MKKIYLHLICLALAIPCTAQKDSSSPTFSSWQHTRNITNTAIDSMKLALEGEGMAQDPAVYKKQLEYFNFTIDYRIKLFYWQFYSSMIIFIVVILIVLTGLYLSYLQFKMVNRQKPMAPTIVTATEMATTANEEARTEITIGKEGISINTAVIGLAILVVSIAFFFLYLKFVYTIEILPSH